MNRIIYFAVFVISLLSITQGKSINNPDDELWKPDSGNREEWLRCHGFPCDQWERTKQKLAELKVAPGVRTVMKPNDTDDTLDGCIWLTEEQIDAMLQQAADDTQIAPSRRQKRKAVNFFDHPFSKWQDRTMPWKLDGAHTENERRVIRGAFSHWEQQTCIAFPEIETQQPFSENHVIVTKEGSGCHSFIGRINRIPQQLNLQRGCIFNLGTPVHEVGHALGLWHEQQRSDRDDYITVLSENIGSYASQFRKVADTHNLVPYDYASVMHYSPYDGSRNGEYTMVAKDPQYQQIMGQRTGLSFLDAKIINIAYCADVCSSPLQCQHGGYQDPKDCSRCRCPDGLAGRFCDQVAPPTNAVCGGDLDVSDTPQYIQSPGYDSPGSYSDLQECSWLFKAPVGSHVRLEFEEDFGLYCYFNQQCHHWVEVKYREDIGEQGPRFCCYERPSAVLVSERSEMLVVFKSNFSVSIPQRMRGFRARVTIVDTTTATPITTTTTAGTDCSPLDLTLVVDSSSGVMENNWPKVLQFLTKIPRKFTLGPDTVRLGVITYGSRAVANVHLGDVTTQQEAESSLNALPLRRGATNTHQGLRLMRQEVSTYRRQSTRQVAILLTDGVTANPAAAQQEASLARQEGVELYIVGISSGFDFQEAFDMVQQDVTSGQSVVFVDSFDDLVDEMYDHAEAVKTMVCPPVPTNPTSPLDWTCSFESDQGMCSQLTQETQSDQFDWMVTSGATPSAETGPLSAAEGVSYLYIETSDPRREMDRAVLYLPEFASEGLHCLDFHYDMYGHHIRSLQVMVQRADEQFQRHYLPLWASFGNQGQLWQRAQLEVNLGLEDKIAFIGTRGGGHTGDVAIDDIHVTDGPCR